MNRRDSKRQLERREIFWHDVDKGEILDPTPVELPEGAEKPPSLEEEMKRFVREQMSDMARRLGMETFEEADDFEDDEADFNEDEDLTDEISEYTYVENEPSGSEEIRGVLPAAVGGSVSGVDEEVSGGTGRESGDVPDREVLDVSGVQSAPNDEGNGAS